MLVRVASKRAVLNCAVSATDIELDYEGAWGDQSKMVMRINVPPSMPIESVQAWATALQAACPKVMSAGSAAGANNMER